MTAAPVDSKITGYSIFGLVAVLFFYFVLFASEAHKPLLLDNMDFPAVAAQTARSGLPVYYRGEENSQALGLYHPPLYIYLLAAWIRIFGFGETQARMFGLLCSLLQGFVTIALLKTLFGSDSLVRWAPWFWLIFLLNPYTLHGAAIADIDTTIYGPLMCAALFTVLRLSWQNGVWREDLIRPYEYALVILAITLCFWAKLTTVLIVFPVICLLLIPRLTIWRAMATTAAVVGASIGAFLITYFLYGKFSGLDVSFTFAFTWMSYMERGASHVPGLAARLMDFRRNADAMVPFMVRWTGLIPWLAAPAVLLMSAFRLWRHRDVRAAHYGLLIMLALATTGYYCGKTQTFGSAPFKYVYVFWGLVLTAPVLLTFPGAKPWKSVASTGNSRLQTVGFFWMPLVLGSFCGASVVQDRLILSGLATGYKWAVLVPALVFLIGMTLSRYKLGGGLLLASFAGYCGLEAGIALAQSRTPYATTYEYGQTGFLDTVAFLRANTAEGDLISSMKDVGFLAHRRYYENYQALYGDDQARQRLIQAIASGHVAYEVFTEGIGEDQLIVTPGLRDWITAHCELVRSFGNYRIYKYHPAATPSR